MMNTPVEKQKEIKLLETEGQSATKAKKGALTMGWKSISSILYSLIHL